MKKSILFSGLFLTYGFAFAQTAKTKYPEPEFANEIYLLKKDSTVMRLEKDASKMDTKVKMAGFGGAESAYSIEGEKSTVRVSSGETLSFVFSTGASANKSSASSDSIMRANGVDPSAMADMMGGMQDPSNSINLYKTESAKGTRKIMLQKSGGMFGGNKASSSKKYTFSAKKIKDGYWELVVDKTLPKGEYAFTVMGMSAGNIDGSVSIFAFGID